MHNRYIGLTLVSNLLFTITAITTSGQQLLDLSSVPSVFTIPALTKNQPGAGLRVKQTTPGWESTNVYHVLYLPKNWKRNQKFPLIVEFAGNGNYKNKYGDVSDGSPEGSSLGYGLSKGQDFIWVCMPFIQNKNGNKNNATQWWGDVLETKKYLLTTLKMFGQKYGVDPTCIILAGFSRGAIACNYIGLYDDERASSFMDLPNGGPREHFLKVFWILQGGLHSTIGLTMNIPRTKIS